MGDDIQEKLGELISQQGHQILYDSNKFTSLMLDLCGGANTREIKILATALNEKIPQHLKSSADKSLTIELRSNLSSRLETEAGLHTDAADWAVYTWAAALGMVTGEYSKTSYADKQRTAPESETNVQMRSETKFVEKLDIRRVSEIMARNPHRVHSYDTLGKVYNIMSSLGFGSVAVVDNDEIVGIITMYDLRIYSSDAYGRVKVEEVMFRNPLIISEETPIDDAKRIMDEKRFASLLVGKNRRLIGIVTALDIRRFESNN